MKFWKMQAAGNDFIVFDGINQQVSIENNTAKKLCNRNFGIGGDQLLIIEKSEKADFKVSVYNADGTISMTYGNSMRAAALYALEVGITDKKLQQIDTVIGVTEAEVKEDHLVRVKVGAATFESGIDFPANFINQSLEVGGVSLRATFVKVGDPHCVVVVEDVDSFPVEIVGPKVETLPIFPNKINVVFLQIVSKSELKVRIWQRGVGETISYGTGAAAAVATACYGEFCRMGDEYCQRGQKIHVRLKGGNLVVICDNDRSMEITGVVEKVYEGEIDIDTFLN